LFNNICLFCMRILDCLVWYHKIFKLRGFIALYLNICLVMIRKWILVTRLIDLIYLLRRLNRRSSLYNIFLLFLNYCLSSFLTCFNCKSSKCLVMFTTWLRFFIALCTSVAFWVIKYNLSFLFLTLNLKQLSFPFSWRNNWKITFAAIGEVKN